MGPNKFTSALIEPFSHQLLLFFFGQIRNYPPTPSCDFLSNIQLTAPLSTLHNTQSPLVQIIPFTEPNTHTLTHPKKDVSWKNHLLEIRKKTGCRIFLPFCWDRTHTYKRKQRLSAASVQPHLMQPPLVFHFQPLSEFKHGTHFYEFLH